MSALIPPLTGDGLLPPGRHSASLGEMQSVFVEAAPNTARRRLLFNALGIYRAVLQPLVPTCTVWVNGGFVTHKADPPKDIDLVLVVDPGLTTGWGPSEQAALAQLLTLQGVFSNSPPFAVKRVQPMAGLIDSFIISESDPAATKLWHDAWSRVTDSSGNVVPGVTKGYLEVTW